MLAQVKVDAKSNEIAAIPALLDLRAIEGTIVTIVAKKADYILALKGNQDTLREDVEVFAKVQKARDFQDTVISTHKTTDADHGRIETRNYTLIHDAGWLQERHKWPGMKRGSHGRKPARVQR